MQRLSFSPAFVLLAAGALFAGACGSSTSGSANDHGACPTGATPSVGASCDTANLTCKYGYSPPACGGTTVVCQGGVWKEQSHTDPQSGCSDAGTDGSTEGGSDAGTCPAGPQSPLGASCDTADLTCKYGYNPLVCGGITVVCQGGVWKEQSHTDPQSGCADAGTDGSTEGGSDAGPG